LDAAIEVAHLDFDEEREKKNDLIDTEVALLIKKGMTYREISKIMNVSPAAIHKYVKRAKLEPNFIANKPGKVTDIVLKKILELKATGMTSRDIGNELKLSKTTVLNHWHTSHDEIPSSTSSSSPIT
jgi:DNA-binding CsgD family transcriptional regulator